MTDEQIWIGNVAADLLAAMLRQTTPGQIPPNLGAEAYRMAAELFDRTFRAPRDLSHAATPKRTNRH